MRKSLVSSNDLVYQYHLLVKFKRSFRNTLINLRLLVKSVTSVLVSSCNVLEKLYHDNEEIEAVLTELAHKLTAPVNDNEITEIRTNLKSI